MTTAAITRPLEWNPPKAAISRVPYLPGLDGMRALAVVAVMIYHANSSWLPGGFLGVEVFFVISGYLITLLLIGEHEKTGTVSLRHFWLRRARRLLPALFVLLVGVTIYTTLFRSDALGQLRGDVIAALTYVTNWYQIWVGQGYTASGDFAPLRHLWSLAVEEQFYLIWPLAMVGLLRLGRRRLPDLSRFLFVGAIVVTVLMAVLFYQGPIESCEVTPGAYWQVGERCISKTDTIYLGTITRAGGLLLGASFAMVWRPVAIMRSPMRSKGRLLDIAALIGLVGLGALCWYLYLIGPDGADPWLFRGGFFVCGLATLAMIAAVTHQRSWSGPLLGNAVLLWIGTRSYGLYLYHWPVYQAIRRVSGNPLTLWQFAYAMVIAAAITELSYRFIETPIRRGQLGSWWRRLRQSNDPFPRRMAATGAAAMVAVAVFAGANLATAELRPNEIATSLDEGEEATTDIGALLEDGSLPPVGTAAVPSTTAPPETTATTVVPTALPTTGPSAATGPTVLPTVPPSTVPPTVAPTTTAAVPPPAALWPLFAFGDSVMQGAAEELQARGILVDVAQNRGMEVMIPVAEGLRDGGHLTGAVVVHLGTNGPPSVSTIDRFFGALASAPKVIVLTAYGPRDWMPTTNERLYAVPERFPNVQIVDWANLAPQCPGDCFYDDDIHINQAGQNYYTQLITQAIGI